VTADRGAVDRARLLIGIGRHEEAVQRLAGHLASEPGDAEALRLLAQAELGRGDPQAALRAAGAAAAADPDSEWAHRLVSVACRRLGRPAEAEAPARTAVRLAPHSWSAHTTLAHALLARRERGLRAEANRQAARAVELAPTQPEAYLVLGLTEGALRHRAKERAAYRRALELDPNNSDALNNLGATDLNRSRLGKAANALTAALHSDPQAEMPRRNLDVLALRLLRQLTIAMIVGGLLLAWLSEGADAVGWGGRATVGAALLAACGVIGWATLRHLPAGTRRYLRGLPRRMSAREGMVGVAFVMVSLAVLALAFLPGPAVAATGSALVAVPQAAGLGVLVGSLRAALRRR
jgi:tetratricopeptide (TPR) repeat protein